MPDIVYSWPGRIPHLQHDLQHLYLAVKPMLHALAGLKNPPARTGQHKMLHNTLAIVSGGSKSS